ncbi:hypothetical protein HWI79_3124 [Cryptosporidium felis]|nr:hypothetical protein HWI79_3124 [Cryptosporidium felis]
MLNISQVLSEVEKKGGKEDLEVEVSQEVPQREFEALREKLLTLGFELQKQCESADDLGASRRRFVLKKESYSESAFKEVVNSERAQESSNTTPTSKSQGLKSKKDNYMDKSQKLEEDLAEIRAEKARQFKNSTKGSQSRSDHGDGGSSNRSNPSQDSSQSSSLRRFMNFDWFTSMFSSRRRNTSQRDRMYLDSSYYRSKNTGCCGSGCGGS